MKKLLALLLAMVLCLGCLPAFSIAAEKDLMDNYVIAQIFKTRALTYVANTNNGTCGYGNGWTKDINISLQGHDPKNVALSMRFYIQNMDDPGNLDIIQNAPSQMIKLSDVYGGTKDIIWQAKNIRCADGSPIKAGEWNDILLPLSTGSGYSAFDFPKDTFKFFWFEFGGMITVPTYVVRLAKVAIVDTSRAQEKPEEIDYDTTYLAAELPFTMDKTIQGDGVSTPTLLNEQTFAPVDVSSHNPKVLKLKMEVEVHNLTHPGDVSALGRASSQIELTSSGKCDYNEIYFLGNEFNWKEGINNCEFRFSSGGISRGDPDYSALNYMRIYFTTFPENFNDRLSFKVRNVCIVDASDEPTIPNYFADGMVFQQNKPMSVWGYCAQDGEKVTVNLKKDGEIIDTVSAVSKDGRWDAALSARPGSYDPYSIEILHGDDVMRTVNDVLIGELWLSAGQSNMEFKIDRDMDREAILEEWLNPYIRMYIEPYRPNGATGVQPLEPMEDIPGSYWGRGDNKAHVNNCSAIAYEFACMLQPMLDVPFAVIDASLGATKIEAWLSREAVASDPDLKYELEKRGLYYDEEFWSEELGTMSSVYNQKVGPLEGLNIAGIIWYQGESNSDRPEIYGAELDLLKRTWGEKFGYPDGDVPFIFSQVAPYYTGGNPQNRGWLAKGMEEGWALSEDENTSMIVIYDCPLEHMKGTVTSDPIHPRTKLPISERFAVAATNMVYGGEGEYTSPVYESMEIKGDAIYVTIRRVGDGLMTLDGSPDVRGFAIAGADGIYVNAQAEIVDATTVKVWNNRVKNPKNVTYAFDSYNQGSTLCSSIGFPVSPFRTADVNDTVTKPDTSLKYFTAQDWMTCDKDVWVYDSQNTAEYYMGYRPSFAATNDAVYSYSHYVFAEGTASLRVDYEEDFTITPVLSYESIPLNWTRYKYLSVKLLNAGESDAEVGLSVKAGSKTYRIKTTDGKTAVTLPANSEKFVNVTFDLGAAGITGSVSAFNFEVSSLFGGTVFFDAFTAGMTDAILTDSELNEAEEPMMVSATELRNLITQIAGLSVPSSAEARAAFEGALAAAEALLADKDATPLAFSDAAGAIIDAIGRLFEDMPDVAALLEEMALADELDLTTAPEKRVKAYQDALAAAEALLDQQVLTQQEVDEALATLQATREALDAPAGLLGDVNGDGKVDSTDARLILQYYAKKIGDGDLDLTLADVNADSKIDSTDARLILQLYAKKISEF